MNLPSPPIITPFPADGIPRPFWSVMIPAYQPNPEYLAQTLCSVLVQDPGSERMQIEVVDDCSPGVDVAALVKSIAGERVKVSHTPKNLGLAGCWNTCIEHARGEWVHILHQDDLVLPGFYETLRQGVTSVEQVGAVFCRHASLNPAGNWVAISGLLRESAGVLENWHEKITICQHVQCPAVVIRRTVYEQLGGFMPQFVYCLDWEMWQRIAARYPVWFTPQILAGYRSHPDSATSHLQRAGADARDLRRVIEFTMAYHPPARGRQLAQQAKKGYAIWVINNSRRLLVDGHIQAAGQTVREALRMSWSWPVIRQLISLLFLWAHVTGKRFKKCLNWSAR